MRSEENIFSYYIDRIEKLEWGTSGWEQDQLCRDIVDSLRKLNVSETYVTDFINVKFHIPVGFWDIGSSMSDFEYGKRGWIEILNTVNEALRYKVPLPLKEMKESVGKVGKAKVVAPSSERQPSADEIVPASLFKDGPAYLGRLIKEINGTYKKEYCTATAVLMRRLVESCMIEAFEKKGLRDQIRQGEDYKTADEIKNELLKNPFGNLSRNERRVLNQKRNILRLGDMCAHNRFYFCQKANLDSLREDVEILIQYLMGQIT
jgi:hypothetical protein